MRSTLRTRLFAHARARASSSRDFLFVVVVESEIYISRDIRRVFAITSIPGGRHQHKSYENIARHLYIAMRSKLVYTHTHTHTYVMNHICALRRAQRRASSVP